MKKILLFSAAFMVVFGLSAQQEVGVLDDGVMSWPTDKAAAKQLVADTVLASTASVTMAVGADGGYILAGSTANEYSNFVFGETVIPASKAVQEGNNNPKDIDGGSPANTLKVPATGAFFKFTVSKDGYLYVFHKASSHKAYTVFEEGSAIGYTFAMHTINEVLGQVYSFELKGEGEYNQIPAGDTILWPEQYCEARTGDIKVSGMGVIKFPVYKDCKYIVNACGSKMTSVGFGFDTDGATPVSITADGKTAIYLLNTPAGISNTNANMNIVSSKYFLLSGEEVAAPQEGNRGLYIVKNIMSDGSISVSKMVLR